MNIFFSNTSPGEGGAIHTLDRLNEKTVAARILYGVIICNITFLCRSAIAPDVYYYI